MKTIPLTHGYSTIVDDEDFLDLVSTKWRASEHGGGIYAISTIRRKNKYINIRMHRELMNCDSDMVVDHINGNTLDNRKENLRICTVSQNTMNSKTSGKTESGLKGVYRTNYGKWRSEAMIDGKRHYCGVFDTKEQAHEAYCRKAIELHKDFANFGNGSVIIGPKIEEPEDV